MAARALRLIDAIRAVHAEALIFVSGVSWAFDLRGFPLRDRSGRPIDGVVYSTHVYPWCRAGLPGSPARQWTRAFGRLAEACPVFAGEWGGGRPTSSWGPALLAYLEAPTVGWTAWSWCDWPPLLRTIAAAIARRAGSESSSGAACAGPPKWARSGR